MQCYTPFKYLTVRVQWESTSVCSGYSAQWGKLKKKNAISCTACRKTFCANDYAKWQSSTDGKREWTTEREWEEQEKEMEIEREEGAGKTDAYCWKCCWLLWLFKKLNNCQLEQAKLPLSLTCSHSLSLPHSPSLLLYYCIFLVHFYGQSVESSPAQAVDHLPCKLEISMHISLSYSSYAAIWPTPPQHSTPPPTWPASAISENLSP